MVVGFEQLKAVGKVGESAVADAFYEAGWWVHLRSQGSRRDLAVMLGERTELIEVKNETRFADSGNVCIELAQGYPLRLSGVFTSESTIYVHYFGDISLVFRTRFFLLDFNEYIRNHGWKEFPGADNGNRGLIVPRRAFEGFWWAKEVATKSLPAAVKMLIECPTAPPRLNGRGGA